jgi:hypothetical protein
MYYKQALKKKNMYLGLYPITKDRPNKIKWLW